MIKNKKESFNFDNITVFKQSVEEKFDKSLNDLNKAEKDYLIMEVSSIFYNSKKNNADNKDNVKSALYYLYEEEKIQPKIFHFLNKNLNLNLHIKNENDYKSVKNTNIKNKLRSLN